MRFTVDFRPEPPRERGLSDEDRRLIDEAVSAGRVQVIPPGVSAMSAYVWNGDRNDIVNTAPDSRFVKAVRTRIARKAALIRAMTAGRN